MKKILLTLGILMTLTACGGESTHQSQGTKTETETEAKQEQVVETESETEAETEAPKNEVLVTIDQVPFEITIREPNSSGTVYAEASYTNNSDYPITNFKLKYLIKDGNESRYLSTSDTVMPGETSPNFKSLGPESQSPDDIEPLKLMLVINNDGTEYHIEYDYKLDTYD